MAMSRGFQKLFSRPVSRPIRMFARPPRSLRKPRARFRPSLEALEDRLVPANFLVTNTADDTAAGSLRFLELSGFPSPTTAGLEQSFTVQAIDDFGEIAAGYRGTVHFSSSEPRAALVELPADYTFTA